MALMDGLGKAWRHLVALVMPPACIGCGASLGPLEPVALCPTCYTRLPWWDKSTILPPLLPKAVDAFAAPCLYDGVMREILLRFKFADGLAMAGVLAKLLLPLLPTEGALLVPVPMHPRALRQRMYNQAALLAQAAGRLSGLPVNVRALKRLKPSDGQAKRTRAQRLRLPSTDFAATPAVKGQHIVLIDDIYTTGATARACALALKSAGAAKVTVITLAYTPASAP